MVTGRTGIYECLQYPDAGHFQYSIPTEYIQALAIIISFIGHLHWICPAPANARYREEQPFENQDQPHHA
jgi:hypothetical protein